MREAEIERWRERLLARYQAGLNALGEDAATQRQLFLAQHALREHLRCQESEREAQVKALYHSLLREAQHPLFWVLTPERTELNERLRAQAEPQLWEERLERWLREVEEKRGEPLRWDEREARAAIIARRSGEAGARAQAFANLVRVWEADPEMLLRGSESLLNEWRAAAEKNRVESRLALRERLSSNQRELAIIRILEEEDSPQLRELKRLLRQAEQALSEAGRHYFSLARERARAGESASQQETDWIARYRGLRLRLEQPLFAPLQPEFDERVARAEQHALI